MIDYSLQLKRCLAILNLLDNNPQLSEVTKDMWMRKLRGISITEEQLQLNMRKVS
jgi:type II secretory pathway component PulF